MSTITFVLVTVRRAADAGFVEQLVYSWRILLGLTRTVAPIPPPLVPLIALSRARGRTRLWTQHDYGSPLEADHAAAGGAPRPRAGPPPSAGDWHVHVAYEFRRPLLAEVLRSAPAASRSWSSRCTPPIGLHARLSRDRCGSYQRRAAAGAIPVLPALDVEVLADLSARPTFDAPRPTAGDGQRRRRSCWRLTARC